MISSNYRSINRWPDYQIWRSILCFYLMINNFITILIFSDNERVDDIIPGFYLLERIKFKI